MELPFEAILNPVELKLAHKIVAGLEPGDPQEEIHAWHLAVTHLFAAERIGKARQPGLPLRPQQIEMGLAVRIMTLSDRKSAALDRHRDRAYRRARDERRDAERRAQKAAQAAQAEARQKDRERTPETDNEGGVLLMPATVPHEEWTEMVKDMERHRESGDPGPSHGYRIWKECAERGLDEAWARGERPRVFELPWPAEQEIRKQLARERAAASGAASGAGSEAGNGTDEGARAEAAPGSTPGAGSGGGSEAGGESLDAPPAPSADEAEAAAQLAWEQAIEASRPAPEDRAEEPEAAGGSPAPGSERDP